MNFRKVNNVAGWITGIIATLVYLITMEATASYWDCGEFLSCAYKLEVGHSPGAPFFMLIQRMFGILAGGNLKNVAYMINAWSAIASGLTILFLFWTITHLAKKLLVPRDTEPTRNQIILIIGSGLVGGLAYTFSDTFWFSAVEAEVYATSSLFTAMVFWAMLKWENVADRPFADRWLLLIAYLIGLSVGIHLLNLLTIPALGMIYYFRRYEVTRVGTVVAFVLGCVALGLVQVGVIQGFPILASTFDVMFVNSFGLPFDSGALFSVILVIAVFAAAIIYARRKNFYLLHTGLLCLVFVLIGFSSYIVPMIRSRADTPIDMTNPDNTLSLVSYVQREQFGSQPILYGPDFDAGLEEIKDDGSKYAKSTRDGKDFYEVVGKKKKYIFERDKQRVFPRIWDNNDPGHVQFYRQFLGLGADERPTGGDNLKYFMGYQMNWMWWRYFLWNYVGRENDLEGQGDPMRGNWHSGLPMIDKIVSLGSHDLGNLNMTSDGVRNNGARNQLYYLPFILGILGFIYQFNRNKRDGFVVAMLFFFTGIAIGIYLNMPPLQPRERDYAFVGSTYAFAIWIGLGVLMLNEWLRKGIKNDGAAYTAVLLALVAVPLWMAKEEWDDHNRSKKTLARATAYNALMSCEKNAVLFTYGDNETYPLWYLQEIEGIRNDVRVINTSLLGIDWYIDQLNYRVNNADAVPMAWKRDDYIGDRREYIRYVDHSMVPSVREIPPTQFFSIGEICKFITSENKLPIEQEPVNYLPTKNIVIPTPAKSALGALAAGFQDTSVLNTDMRIRFSDGKNVYTKSDLAQLNIIAAVAAAGWQRPLYFSNLQETDGFGNLNDFMKLEGTVYRLMPFSVSRPQVSAGPADQGFVDIEKSLKLFRDVYIWGGAERKDVYFDEKNRQNFMPYRLNVARIADELSSMGRNSDAKIILDRVTKGITEKSYAYDFTALYMAQAYYAAGAMQQAGIMARKVADNARDDIRYFETLSDNGREAMAGEANRNVQIMAQMAMAAIRANDKATTDYIIQGLQPIMNAQSLQPGTIRQLTDELQRMRSGTPQLQQVPQQ
jgi:hypothetical protein